MFKLVTLVENTTSSPQYKCKHGLCLYIETEKHKILFDLGQDSLFIDNARKMNIDISEIDTVVISHGHKDHGGALKALLTANSKAKVYVKREAFEPHFIKVLGLPFSVGLDEQLLNNDQIIQLNDNFMIDEELFLFSNVQPDTYFSKSNSVLYTRKQNQLISDNFSHEQNLIITVNNQKILISGCSHAGIVNIQSKAEALISGKISTVIGGFHLYNPPTRKYESNQLIDDIANALSHKNSTYYTCHCTGIKAYERMKNTLGDQLSYLSVGSEILL